MFRLNRPLRKRRPSSFREGRRDASSPPVFRSAVRRAQRPSQRSRTGAARLRMGGEEESTRTGDSNPGCNYLVRGYSPSMHFFWGGDMPHYSPPLPFRRGDAGCPFLLASPHGRPARGRLGVVFAGWCAQARVQSCAPGRGHVRGRWLAGPRPCPARGSRTGAERLRMGDEGECARTWDSNPGCNYPVRGYSPSMHFFWGCDMPHYSAPLRFRRGRAGCRCVLASP